MGGNDGVGGGDGWWRMGSGALMEGHMREFNERNGADFCNAVIKWWALGVENCIN